MVPHIQVNLLNYHAKAINKEWKPVLDLAPKMASAFIATGQKLIEAKGAIDRARRKNGQKVFWLDMFNRKKVKESLPFSEGTARKLMLIAKYPPLQNRSISNGIPPHWDSLYQLTKLPPPEFEKHLKAGDIHADLKNKDIAKWMPKKKPKKSKPGGLLDGSDPTPPEISCFRDVEKRLRQTYFTLDGDAQTQLKAFIYSLLKNLSKGEKNQYV